MTLRQKEIDKVLLQMKMETIGIQIICCMKKDCHWKLIKSGYNSKSGQRGGLFKGFKANFKYLNISRGVSET